jgi:probable O-glycosylation ligase (exosortase A-associated)
MVHHKSIRKSTDKNDRTECELQVSTPLGVRNLLKGIWQGFRQEHAAFVVTCIYLIFEYNRPHMIYPALNIIPWGKTLLLLSIFLAFSDRTSKAPPSAAWRSMLFFSSCVLLSMFFAFSPSSAAKEWTMFFGWFFVVLLLTSVVNTRKRLFLFLVVYFLCNLKMAQHGFRSWAMGGFGFSSWGVTGSPGWFQNSGEFSMEMVVFLPLVLAYIAAFRLDWSRWVRLFFYILVIMVIGSIIASASRGGILGLIVVGFWCLSYSRQRIKALIILTLVALLIFIAIPPEFKARFDTAGKDKTSLSRMTYWEYGLNAVRENPLTGVGFRNWTIWVPVMHPELVMRIGSGDHIEYHVEVIHNTYLEAATELGLLGLSVYFAILLQIFISNHRSFKIALKVKDRFLAATAMGLNGSLIGYMVPSYFMSVLYYPYIWILLSLTVCVSSICRLQASQP